MQENKSLVQEALIQMRNVEEAIAENAKGILHSTMKEEINQLVKESLSEQDEVDLDADIEDDVDTDDVDMDVDMDVDNDTEDMDMDVDTEFDMDSEDESPIDLTDASDEEILKVFKAMGEEDGIIVKKDGEDIHLTDNDADTEYLVKLGESEEDEINMNETDEIMNQTETDESVQDVIDAIFSKNGDTSEVDIEDIESDDEMMESDDDEVVYEIHLDDEDEMMESDDEELDESDDDDEMMESYQDEDEMMESDDDDEEEELDEDEESIDESYNHRRAVREGKSTVKPKGVGIGSGPKFTYKNKAAGGFKEDKKEGPKSVGTGKAKFEYKKGANMEGKSKVVKAETKEGYGSKKHEFKRKKVDGVEKKAGTKDGHYKDYEKTETKEAARTYGFGSKEGRGLRKGITNNRNYVYSNNGVKVESTQAEVSMLREKNEEYRKALNIFREKLNEVAIFNSNLAYATRLFTEHSTTKKEKINILRRFDGVETLKESKNLYKSIKDELSNGDTQSITESVETKLNKQVSTGSSVNLIESKTYENPQFLRIKDLMSKL
jgi:ribonuclease E